RTESARQALRRWRQSAAPNRWRRRAIPRRRGQHGSQRRRQDESGARRTPVRRLPLRSARIGRIHMALEFLREMLAGEKEARFYGTEGHAEQSGHFFEGVTFHRIQQQHQAIFVGKFSERSFEMRLKFTGSGDFLSGGMMFCPRPKRLPRFAALLRADSVEREAERDAHEPAAESLPVAEAVETAIGAKQSFLRDIFSVSRAAE